MKFPKKILLVAYEPSVAALVRRAFEATGAYQVKEEHDSRLTFHARWFQPDLILFDLAPARSSVDHFTQQLQDDPALCDTPIMFVKVDDAANGGVVSGGILSGYSFLANPVPLDQLVSCVSDLLRPVTPPRRNHHDALAA